MVRAVRKKKQIILAEQYHLFIELSRFSKCIVIYAPFYSLLKVSLFVILTLIIHFNIGYRLTNLIVMKYQLRITYFIFTYFNLVSS